MHIPGDNMPADGLTKASYKAQKPLLEFLKHFRLGYNGVPMKCVDAMAGSYIAKEIKGGRIDLNNFDSLKLKHKLDPFVEKKVREPVLALRNEWETLDVDETSSLAAVIFDSDSDSDETALYCADDILPFDSWLPVPVGYW